MLINVDNLPRDIRWMCGSDFMLMIAAAKYYEENNIPYIELNDEFKKYCVNNGLVLELSTMNQKLTYFTKCGLATKLGPKKFIMNENVFLH